MDVSGLTRTCNVKVEIFVLVLLLARSFDQVKVDHALVQITLYLWPRCHVSLHANRQSTNGEHRTQHRERESGCKH